MLYSLELRFGTILCIVLHFFSDQSIKYELKTCPSKDRVLQRPLTNIPNIVLDNFTV